MIYKRYLKDYAPEIQRILKEEHGIDIKKNDITAIGMFPMKNIAVSLLRGDEVVLPKIDFFYSKKRVACIKAGKEGQST